MVNLTSHLVDLFEYFVEITRYFFKYWWGIFVHNNENFLNDKITYLKDVLICYL